ncbi:MAG: HEAT repeat domain-containing protein [Bacteroidales bacterium]|nr:HEAT repeat domain-containing protein [Bacteroidales bacterium]
MKRFRIGLAVIIAGILLAVMLTGILAVDIWIRHDVKENIAIAQENYSGSAEEALISFLQDEKNSFNDRTHVAVWTLGMLKSTKALPVLKGYYHDDPKGLSCKGHHNQMQCQYGLHKAIVQIEGRWMYSTAGLNR